MLGGAAQAEPEHAVTPEASLVPVVTREVCTTTIGASTRNPADGLPDGGEPGAKGNPALEGVCTIYYGRRTCY